MSALLLLAIALTVCGCADRRTLRDPKHEPDILKIAYTIDDESDIKTLSAVYGPPLIMDFKQNVIAYTAEYDVDDDSAFMAIMKVLTLDFTPDGRERWYLIVDMDGSYKNEAYRYREPRSVDSSTGKTIHGEFDDHKEKDCSVIRNSRNLIPDSQMNDYRKKEDVKK